ncbi:hypothetical protein HII31_13404 [Pseudocercospora fuligena]|uniref:3'-5' exonuclease domain-containing protein n=1 Tax=Pseudocercospora fuligena TaxID=685502 RepID=A0A8H6VEE7_9PEZI|nr:hypothetical protein HII31_13404 [Pseudocercospora fuligena]
MSSNGKGSFAKLDLFPIDYSFSDSDQDDEGSSPTPYATLWRLGSASTPNITTQAEDVDTDSNIAKPLPYGSSFSSKYGECKPPSTGLARNATGDPTHRRLLLPMQFLEGRRVSRGGNVLDHNGEVLAKVVEGNIKDCAGAYIRKDGEIRSVIGEQLGFVAIVGGNASRDAFAEWRESTSDKSEGDEETETSPPVLEDQSPEAMLSTNAIKCAELAKQGERVKKSTLLSLQGDGTQQIEFERMERKINSLADQMRSIEHEIPAHMHSKLYEELPFREVTASYNKILATIAEQRAWRTFEDESAAIGGGLRPKVKLSQAGVIVVDEKEAVADMVDVILSTLDNTAAFHLALDLQGKQLGRGGDISIATVYIPALTRVYLIDVAVLRDAAFGCSGTGDNSLADLRSILQNSTIKKLMFDCRLASITLHDAYSIKLEGVVDSQLTFCATRTKPKDRKQVNVLSKAVLHATAMDKEDQKAWKSDVKWGNACFYLGGIEAEHAKLYCTEDSRHLQTVEYQIAQIKAESGPKELDARPIPQLLTKFCIAQVILLGPLLEYCTSHPVWNEALAKRVEEETCKRLGMRDWKELPKGDRVWSAAPEGWADFEQRAE